MDATRRRYRLIPGLVATAVVLTLGAWFTPDALAQEQAPTPPPLEPSTAPTPPAPAPVDPSDDAELTDESVENARESLKSRRNSSILYPSNQPTTEAALPPATLAAIETAGLPALDPSAPRPPLLSEGSFIVRRRGVLLVTDWGAHIFAFAPDEAGVRPRPMIVLPSDTLGRMESAAAATQAASGSPASDARRVRVVGSFVITGQVTAYRGRNYITPTAFALADDRSIVAPAPPPANQDEPTDQPSRKPEDDPEVSGLISDLESLRTTPRSTTPIRDQPPDADEESLVAEGSTIPRRTGRLVRTSRGEVAVAFDSGTEGRMDPPMVLLPCAATEGIERAATRYGDATTFEFSGRVFAYRGRNYLLPLMYVAEASRNVKPLQ